MNLLQKWWFFYLLVEATRLLGFRDRLRLPTLRGQDMFFDLRVPPGFYDGPGRRLLRIYKIGMPLAYLIEALVLAPVFYWGFPGWILFSVASTSLMLMLWGRWWMRRVNRMAKPFALPCEPSATTVSLAMEPRSLATYRSVPMELLIWTFDLVALVLLIQSARISMNSISFNPGNLVGVILRLFGLAQPSSDQGLSYGAWLFWPLIVAYIQAGALLVRYAILAWPIRLPADSSDQIRKHRDGVRRYLIRTCDWCRFVFALTLLIKGIGVRFPATVASGWWHWFTDVLFLSLTAVIVTWSHYHARQFIRQARDIPKGRSAPKISRIVDPARFLFGGLVYYDPDSPSVLIPSRAGYALNFADRRAYVTIAYLGGLALLAFIHLRFGWG